jgi:NAD(P)H dehydrogenase (quinone)
MLQRAIRTLKPQGHSVEVSNLYAQSFDPVSGPRNFTDLVNPDFFKQQDEERHAWEINGFAPDL